MPWQPLPRFKGMSLKRNIIANYAGAGAIVLFPVVALPWYLRFLGPEQFGLISFVATLQIVMGLVDAGLGQALVREFAVQFASRIEGKLRVARLLFAFERIYWIFALVMGLFVALMSGIIATQWLGLNAQHLASGELAIVGASAIFAIQFPGALYRSLLIGGQAQVTLSLISIASAFARHFGGVLVVMTWPTIFSYLLWHGFVALLETIIRAKFAWRIVDVDRRQVVWDSAELKPLWRMMMRLTSAVLLGALAVQSDRIILSRMVSIDQFGFYVIAASISLGLLQLIYPILQAIMPKAVALKDQPIELLALSQKLVLYLALVVGVSAMGYLLFGKLILHLWLRNLEAEAAIYPLLSVLLFGTALNAFYNVGYMNWMVAGKAFRVFQVNALTLILTLSMVPPLVNHYGSIGAAFSWVMINLIGLLLSFGWLIKKPSEKGNGIS
jgi:O-antigen/teichoic acid export membrane protein